jgi:hypothetical protein
MPIGLCTVRPAFGKMHTMFQKTRIQMYHYPLLRVDTPVRAKVHAASERKWWLRDKSPGQRKEYTW